MGLLEDIRHELQERERHRAKYHRHKDRVEELRDRLRKENAMRRRLKERAKELHEELRQETEKDAEEEGLHGDEWEARVRDRVDELADAIEVCEFHIDAVLERVEKNIELRHEAAELIEDDARRIDRLRERKRRREEDREGQLSEHFHVEEFRCRDGTAVPDNAVAALKDNCERYLEPVRARFGVIGVTSGYRTPSYNASIDGATNSIHMYNAHPNAAAVDHVSSTHSASELQRFHDANTHPDAMGFYAGFTHVDNRGRIGWAAPARWQGAG